MLLEYNACFEVNWTMIVCYNLNYDSALEYNLNVFGLFVINDSEKEHKIVCYSVAIDFLID